MVPKQRAGDGEAEEFVVERVNLPQGFGRAGDDGGVEAEEQRAERGDDGAEQEDGPPPPRRVLAVVVGSVVSAGCMLSALVGDRHWAAIVAGRARRSNTYAVGLQVLPSADALRLPRGERRCILSWHLAVYGHETDCGL